MLTYPALERSAFLACSTAVGSVLRHGAVASLERPTFLRKWCWLQMVGSQSTQNWIPKRVGCSTRGGPYFQAPISMHCNAHLAMRGKYPGGYRYHGEVLWTAELPSLKHGSSPHSVPNNITCVLIYHCKGCPWSTPAEAQPYTT